MWTRRSGSAATNRFPGRRVRKHRMRFGNTSLLSMLPAAKMRAIAVGMAERRIAASVEASRPSKFSLTDPQAAWVTRKGIDPFFAYDANYLIDNKVGIILDAEGTRANRKEEIAITQTMVERIERRFNIRPERLVGDTVYGVARLLKWLVDRKITPHVPVWDKSTRHNGIFSRADFVFDQERNVYICPGGAELTSTGNIDQGHIVYYRANKHD